MDDRGRIHELTEEEHRKAEIERAQNLANRSRQTLTPITDLEAAFFKSKGMAFRELWGKRFARGLTGEQQNQLNADLKIFKEELDLAKDQKG